MIVRMVKMVNEYSVEYEDDSEIWLDEVWNVEIMILW